MELTDSWLEICISLAIGITFFIIAVLLLTGHGRFLISGYNTMSKKERLKYDVRKVERVLGMLILIHSFCLPMLGLYGKSIDASVGFIILGLLMLISILAVIYVNVKYKL